MYRKKALNVVEVVVALVILTLLAALAIPRFTRAASPNPTALLRGQLKVLRVAIERYYQDHGSFPGRQSDGTNPAASAAVLVSQLTRFTDAAGRAADQKDATHCFGPYLRDGIPACPVRPSLGKLGIHVIVGSSPPTFTAEAAAAGWVYNCATGEIVPNSDAADATGRSYASY